MVPASAVTAITLAELSRASSQPLTQTAGRRRRVAGRIFLSVTLVASVASALFLGFTRPADLSSRVIALEGQLVSARADLFATAGRAATLDIQGAQLNEQVSKLMHQLKALRAAKVHTVVKTKTVTETQTVTRWVPSGEGISVEVTGFADLIGIHDVQLTHSYGYTDVIGIATNKSGRTIAYAQLGCTFLDANGNVLANEITNKQNWAPGATWGFVCSGQTDAAAAILRVDEMS
jgi:hypothetical protein